MGFDEIVAHADEIGGVVGQNLRDHLEFLPLGKRLVTVACDLSNLPAPKALTVTVRDTETLRDLYTRYEFRTWLRELDALQIQRAFQHLKKLGLREENRLRDGKLPKNLPNLPALRELESLDAHPLVREHFGQKMEAEQPAA